MSAVLGRNFGPELARKIGLDPNRVAKITITIEPDSVVMLEFTVHADTALMELITKRYELHEVEP